MPQTSAVSGNQPGTAGTAGTVETVRIDQVNYAGTNEGSFTIQVQKQLLYGVLIGVAVLLFIAAVLIWVLSSRKKQNPEMKSMYKKLMDAKDINEVFNQFNEMLKYRYQVSLKASPLSAVRKGLPNSELADRVTEIMGYMESPQAREDKGVVYLKEKIKEICNRKLLYR
jgi:hypothetical protein